MEKICGFKIISLSKRQMASYGKIYIVETTSDLDSDDSFTSLLTGQNNATDEFRLAIDSPLIADIQQAYKNDIIWYADMSKFQTKDGVRDVNGNVGHRAIHEELVNIDLEAIVEKAIRKSVLAKMGFAGIDELETYTAKVTTIKDGYIYKNHNLENILAEDESDAYKMMLLTVSQREGRNVRPSDILSCVISPNGERPFEMILK